MTIEDEHPSSYAFAIATWHEIIASLILISMKTYGICMLIDDISWYNDKCRVYIYIRIYIYTHVYIYIYIPEGLGLLRWGRVGWGGADNVQVHVRTGVMLRNCTFRGT